MFLSVSNLKKSYNTGIITHVLKGVALEMERGQIGVILGPSGSGKSTLMNIIGGVDRANSGTVEVDGKHITDLNDNQLVEYRRESVGFVFQFYNLVPNLTVKQVDWPMELLILEITIPILMKRLLRRFYLTLISFIAPR